LPLAEHDETVDAFATDANDHPLHVRRLPATPRRNDHAIPLSRGPD
jgi:hypothetical protein